MITKMKFRNVRGQEIIIGHVHPYWLDRHVGINTAEAQVSSFPTMPDGIGVSNTRLFERKIDLVGRITDKTLKTWMLTVCAPKMEGDLLIGDRGIRCIVQRCEQSPPEPYDPLWKFAITFLAPFPYFYDVRETEKNIVSWDRQWTFPFTLPQERTFIFGTRAKMGQTTAFNEGQVACPCVFRITARGDVQNPRITIAETGEELAFQLHMNSGDVIEVDTFSKRVEFNGERNFSILTRNTAFPWLPEGESAIRYIADSGAAYMNVDIRFRAYYIGGIE